MTGRNRSRLILASVVVAIVVADQASKYLIRQTFELGQSVQVLGSFFRLTYIHNAAGAFGIVFGHQAIYYIASSAIALYLIVHLYRSPHLRQWSIWGLAFVLGGAVGNLIDRLRLGEVVDFLDFEFFNITLPTFNFWFIHFRGYDMTRWPIFNLADSAVTVGIVVIILSMWLDSPPQDTAESHGTAETTGRKKSPESTPDSAAQ